MRVQVRAEFVLAPYIGLYDRPSDVEPVILGLAHQRLGDRRNVRLHLDSSVRIDIGHLRVPEPENIEQPVVTVNIARHCPADDQKAVFAFGEREAAERRQVPDQVPGPVIGRREEEAHDSLFVCHAFLPVQIYDHIFFFIQVKALKPLHGNLLFRCKVHMPHRVPVCRRKYHTPHCSG